MNLVRHDDSVLHRAIAPFEGDPRTLAVTAARMLDVMRAGNGVDTGCGLAANQIGLERRMLVMSFNGKDYVCINPRVVRRMGKAKWGMEGCLTAPVAGSRRRVLRHEAIIAAWTDANGVEQQQEFHGTQARCFQHELDHLDGKTIFDGDQRQVAA